MGGVGRHLVRLASWRTLLVMALTMGVLGMQSGRGTLAYFTDSVSSPGNVLTAGQLKLLLNGSNPGGSITLSTGGVNATKLKPTSVLYAYWTVTSDDSSNDGVPAVFNGTSPGTITITRTGSTTPPSTAAFASALDGRLNIVVKDVSNTPAINSSATCAVPANWNAGSNTLLTTPNTVGATNGASRPVLPSGTPTAFITSSITIDAGVTKGYCAEFTWVDGTPAVDNPAKQGSNNYVITFNGAGQ